MGHLVRIQTDKQFVQAIEILNELPGTWHSRGTDDTTELLVLDSHYQALVRAGVISANGKEGKTRGKKEAGNKVKP